MISLTIIIIMEIQLLIGITTVMIPVSMPVLIIREGHHYRDRACDRDNHCHDGGGSVHSFGGSVHDSADNG